MEEEQRERTDFVEDVRIEKPNSNSNDHDEMERLNTSYHDISVFTNQIGDVPLENGSTDCFDGRQHNPAEQPVQLGNDLTLPLADNSQEVISISDDEDEPDVNQYFLNSQPPRPLPPMPMTFPSMMMGPPPPPRHFMPHSLGGPDNVITLSDDDDDEASSGSKMSGGKKRKRASRRGTMFNPQVCVFCYKPKRENICMAKHLISRHWSRIRSQNMGNSKVTDYSNLKDDREIPADRGLERRERYERPPPPPMASMPPPLPLSVAPGSSQAFGRPQPHLIEQPLRPSISGFSRPAPFNPGFAGKEERKSLGREVAEELGHPSNRKLVQHQLSMMLHAHKCDGRARKPNSLLTEDRPCVVPNCSNTKELLKHLPACQAETDCLMPKCFMSKQILKWALSEDSPDVMRETRSELNRQIRAGLPSEVVKWATKHPFEAEQWKSWRETKSSGQTNSNSNPATHSLPANDIKLPPTNPLTTPAATSARENSVPDWRKKYQLAAEKKKELAAQKMKNGSSNQKVEEVDRIVPSQAPVDILSSLLSAQTATADLRKGRRPEENKAETRSVPKLVPAPKEAATSGDDAAKYNSMLV